MTETAKAEAAKATSKTDWLSLGGKIAFAVFGTILGVGGALWKTRSDGSMRYLDYEIRSNDAIVSTPAIPNHKVALELDGSPVESISQVEVLLYNRSDKDFEGVEIYIDLNTVDGGPLYTLTNAGVGAKGLTEGVTQTVYLTTANPPPPKQHLAYVLKTANRLEDVPVFRANILTIGKKAPTATVSLQKTGLEARQLQSNPSKTFWDTLSPWIIFAACLVLMFRALDTIGELLTKRKPK